MAVGQAQGAAGTQYLPVVFTNTGQVTCTLQGYPGVSMVGPDGVQIGPPAMRENPTPEPLVSLAPGRTTVAGFSYADVAACRAPVTTDGLRVYPPNQTAGLFAPYTGIKECAGSPQDTSMINPIGQ